MLSRVLGGTLAAVVGGAMMIGWQNPPEAGKFRPNIPAGGSSTPSPTTVTTIRDVKGAFDAVSGAATDH